MRSPGLISTRLWSSVTQTSGSASCKSSSSSLPDAEFDDLEATSVRADRVDRHEGITKRHDAEKGGAPVGDLRQVVHEPAQGGLHLIEGSDHHHERAEAHVAAEIARRRHHDRDHERKPAIAGRDPGKAREAACQAGHQGHHAVDRLVEQAALIRLAIVQDDSVSVLADTHERDAQICLPCVALVIERDKRAADVPSEQRTAQRISERAPDHVAWDRDAPSADPEYHLVGEDPEHAHKAHEQQGGLQQADREDGREVAQVLGVLLDALIGIDADLAREAQQVNAFADQPLVEQVMRQPFAQPDVNHLPQPGLADDQHQQTARDHSKDYELGHEIRHVPLLDRLVEVALPDVEPDLPGRVGANYDDHAERQ